MRISSSSQIGSLVSYQLMRVIWLDVVRGLVVGIIIDSILVWWATSDNRRWSLCWTGQVVAIIYLDYLDWHNSWNEWPTILARAKSQWCMCFGSNACGFCNNALYQMLRYRYIRTDRAKWRHSNLWSRYDLHVVGHGVVLCKVNWWRFAMLFK